MAEGEQCLKIQSKASEVNSIENVVSQPLDYKNINISLEACGLLCSVDEDVKVSFNMKIKLYSLLGHATQCYFVMLRAKETVTLNSEYTGCPT